MANLPNRRKGWVKIMKDFMDTRSYTNANATAAYMHCQMWASYDYRMVRGVQLKPGQFITSVTKFADECGMTYTQMRSALNMLESDGLIVREAVPFMTNNIAEKISNNIAKKSTKTGTLITVVGYGFESLYDSTDNEEHSKEHSKENNEEHSNNIINRKKIKNKNPDNEDSSSRCCSETTTDTITTTTTTMGSISDMILQKYPFEDPIILNAVPELLEEYKDNPEIVIDACRQAYEGGKERQTLLYIRSTCGKKQRDLQSGASREDDPIMAAARRYIAKRNDEPKTIVIRDESIEDWD